MTQNCQVQNKNKIDVILHKENNQTLNISNNDFCRMIFIKKLRKFFHQDMFPITLTLTISISNHRNSSLNDSFFLQKQIAGEYHQIFVKTTKPKCHFLTKTKKKKIWLIHFKKKKNCDLKLLVKSPNPRS